LASANSAFGRVVASAVASAAFGSVLSAFLQPTQRAVQIARKKNS
jgi:hypothetical protein